MDFHTKPTPDRRSVEDALKTAERLRQDLPKIIQVMAWDRDQVILADHIADLTTRLSAAEKDRDHWKNNHATEVRRARVLKERTDMPLERVEAYEKWGEDLARLAAAEKERDEAKAQLETERQRLAACGVAALGYFEGCADEYYSASLGDVLKLRADCDTLRRNLEGSETALATAIDCGEKVTKERDEAIAWGEKLKEALQAIIDSADQNQAAVNMTLLMDAKDVLYMPAPAALSHLRQQVRLETIREVVAEWEKPWSQAPSQFVERLYKMLAEQEKQG